jgi:hypothetical protein
MDIISLGHSLFRKRWYYLQPAAHMYYFNIKTIKLLLHNFGYKLIKVHRTNPVKNLIHTLSRTAYSFIFNTKHDWQVNNKRMYLADRKKSLDDMFLVIAKKIM